MEDIEMIKQEMLDSIKQGIINVNKQITEDMIKKATKEELIRYLELISKIKDELNVI